MIEEQRLGHEGERHRSFQAIITVEGDPDRIQRAVGLLGFVRMPTFSCRSLGSRQSRIVLSVPDSTAQEAKRAIEALARAIEHVLTGPHAASEEHEPLLV